MAACLRNLCCYGKAISSKYPESVFVALIIQHARHMRHVVICGLSGSTLFFYISISHKLHDFPKINTEHKMCVLVFSTNLSETFLILRRTERKLTINVQRNSCKVPFILVIF